MQIAKKVFLFSLEVMKKVLDLLSYKYGKKSDEFLYMKKEIMDYVYFGLQKLFKKLEQGEVIEKCSKHTSLRKGFKECECGGSGYVNIRKKNNDK